MDLYLTVNAENLVVAAHLPPAPFAEPVDPPIPADDLPALRALARKYGLPVEEEEGDPAPARRRK